MTSNPYAFNIHGTYVSEGQILPLVFEHRDQYRVGGSNTLQNFLHGVIDSNKGKSLPGGSGLLVCLIENSDGLGEVLGREFTNFPRPILSYIKSPNAFAPGTSLAPEWRDASGLSFLENYLCISEAAQDGVLGHQLGPCKVRSMPLAVWTGGRLGNEDDAMPVIMVIGDWENADVMRFIRRCQGGCEEGSRLDRLLKCKEWIYNDIFSTFNDWIGLWDAARSHLRELNRAVNEQIGAGNILDRMRKLNKATATNIMLRESLVTQAKSLYSVQKLAKEQWDRKHSIEEVLFINGCEDISNALDHYFVLAKGNLEQLQNLISMMISLEQISQGQSVGRLNVLAFTFLPLSFTATLFGMTQITLSPRLYPAYALPMLALTILVVIGMPKVTSVWDRGKQFKLVEWLIESRSFLRKSANGKSHESEKGTSSEEAPPLERGRTVERELNETYVAGPVPQTQTRGQRKSRISSDGASSFQHGRRSSSVDNTSTSPRWAAT